jgi:hypothetical protein
MKSKILLSCVVAIAASTVAWVMWPAGKAPSVDRREAEAGKTTLSKAPESPRGNGAAPDSATAPAGSGAASSRLPTTPPRRIAAIEVLAMVNRKPVKLEALMPVGPGVAEKEMTREEYRSRLQRAIDAELIAQAALAEGVTLTKAQQERLAKIPEKYQGDLERYRNIGVTWSTAGTEQVEFEKQFLKSQFLEQNLVLKKAAVYPSPDPEIQSRYEQARSELLAQLAAGAVIIKTVPSL